MIDCFSMLLYKVAQCQVVSDRSLKIAPGLLSFSFFWFAPKLPWPGLQGSSLLSAGFFLVLNKLLQGSPILSNTTRCQQGPSCWLFANTTAIEYFHYKNVSAVDEPLSPEFLQMSYVKDWAIGAANGNAYERWFLERTDEDLLGYTGLTGDSSQKQFLGLVRSYGLVPASYFKGGISLQKHFPAIMNGFDRVIQNWKRRRGGAIRPKDENWVEFNRQLNAVLSDILKIKWPEESSDGFCPLRFAKAYLGKMVPISFSLTESDEFQIEEFQRVLGEGAFDFNQPRRLTTLSLKRSEFSSVLAKLLERNATGTISFVWKEGSFEAKQKISAGAKHVVAVVGFLAKPISNRVSHFEVQNSWGEDNGERSRHFVSVDYLGANADSVSFYIPVP